MVFLLAKKSLYSRLLILIFGFGGKVESDSVYDSEVTDDKDELPNESSTFLRNSK